MIISHRRRFIFLKTSKSAGSSVEMALSRFCGDQDIITGLKKGEEAWRLEHGGRGRQNDDWPLGKCGWRQWRRLLRGLRAIDPHVRAIDAKRLVSPEQWQSYFKFAFVRNPWDRVVSQWFFMCPGDDRPPLAEFFHSKHMRSMQKRGRMIYTIDDRIVVDHVYRYEALSDEMKAISERLDLSEVPALPQAKGGFRKDRRHYSQWYDNTTRDLVAERFKAEIDAFGYVFEDRR